MSQHDQRSETEQSIRDQIDDDLLSSAEEAGVDVDSIIEREVRENGGEYSESVVKNFAEDSIQNEIRAANSDTVSGLLVGSRDDYASNRPRRWSCLRPNGEHIEIDTWGGSVDGPEGNDIEIPTTGAQIEAQVEYENPPDKQWDSWKFVKLNSIRDRSVPELVNALNQIAVSPDEITAADEYEVRVVKAPITWFNNQTVWPADDSKERYDGPVLMEDERPQFQPHFEASLSAGDGRTFRIHQQRQGHGRPIIEVADLEKLCQAAYERYEDPGDQAEFVGNAIRGREIIAVGTISKFERDRRDGEPVTYVDMNITALFDATVDGQTDDAAEDATDESADESADEEPDEPPEDPAEETEESSDSEDSGVPEAVAEADYNSDLRPIASSLENVDGRASRDDMVAALREELGDDALVEMIESDGGEAESASEPEPDESDVESVREDIETYCGLTGEDFDDMTVADVNENISGVDANDAVIRAALGGAEGSDEPEEGSLEAVLQEYFVGDSYNCPDDDCLGGGGSIGDLGAHVADEHDLTDYDGPEDWLRQHA